MKRALMKIKPITIKSEKLIALKYEILLFSLFLLLFGQLFVPLEYKELAHPLFFVQTIFAGIILLSERKLWRNSFIVLFIFVLGIDLYNYTYQSSLLETFSTVIYILFFLSMSIEIYRHIYKSKEVKIAMIAAVVSGFIMLCIISTLFFTLIEIQEPASFSNIGTGETQFQNLTYFSFVTTLTIGYGDIIPLTEQAKKAVMLVALLGNFYTVFVAGIVIGKYLNPKKR